MRKGKFGICPFCAKEKRLTRDHVPPENLFPKPRPSTLITVPGCDSCNRGSSKDDEYFRLVLNMHHTVDGNPLVKKNIPKIVDSLGRKKAFGFACSLFEVMAYGPVYTKSGLYIGNRPTYRIDDLRLNRTAEKILKGLYYCEFNEVVSEEYDVFAISCFSLPRIHDSEFLSKIKDRLQYILPMVDREVVRDGFRYRYRCFSQQDNSSIWIMLFYERIGFMGFIINTARN